MKEERRGEDEKEGRRIRARKPPLVPKEFELFLLLPCPPSSFLSRRCELEHPWSSGGWDWMDWTWFWEEKFSDRRESPLPEPCWTRVLAAPSFLLCLRSGGFRQFLDGWENRRHGKFCQCIHSNSVRGNFETCRGLPLIHSALEDPGGIRKNQECRPHPNITKSFAWEASSLSQSRTVRISICRSGHT